MSDSEFFKSWYAVVSNEVLFDKELNSDQKILVAMISNAMNHKGYCWATNEYFANALDCSVRTIQRNLEHLEAVGYVSRIINIDPETKQVIDRVLMANERKVKPNTLLSPVTGGGDTGDMTPPVTDVMYNNKVFNNKENNTDTTLSCSILATDTAKDEKQAEPVKNPSAKGGKNTPRVAPPPQEKFYKKEYEDAISAIAEGSKPGVYAETIKTFLEKYPAWPHPEPYVDLWNLFATKYRLPAVQALNETRKRKIEIRSKEPQFKFYEILKAMGNSTFLTGDGWKTSFDWLIENDTNYLKTLEGNYK